jgi:hypothetical protein
VLSGLRLGPRRAQQLRDHLATHPDALTSGNSDGPAVLMRLLDALAPMHPQVERVRCVTCGETRRLRRQARGGRVCGRCHAADSVEQCVRCGEAARICCRDEAGGVPAGGRCRPSARAAGRSNPVAPTESGPAGRRAHRAGAAPRPRRTCVLCGKPQRIHSPLPLGDVCTGCYTRIRRWPSHRAGCGQRRPLIGPDDQQRRIRGPCAGDTREWTCRTCGRFAALLANGFCLHCVAHDRVRRLLADPAGGPRPQLVPVLRLLEAEIEADPFTILFWRLSAVRWTHLVRRDWTSYLAARKAQVTPPTGKSVSHGSCPPAKR